jgi:subtilase family serine protease
MGIDCSDLPEAKGEAIGFGGMFKTKMINRLVTLTFRSNNHEYEIDYNSGFKVICIPPNATKEQREKILRYTPSVLGMDVLLKFKTCVDEEKVELELNQ